MELRDMPYEQYLQTKYWKDLSEKVKERAGYKCQVCSSEEDLHAHHRSYENKGVEELEINDLVCLCVKCHKMFHDTKEVKVDTPSEAIENYMNDMENRYLKARHDITSFEYFNSIVGQIQGSNLFLFAGVKDMGHKQFLNNMLVEISSHSEVDKSIFFALESNKTQTMDAAFAIEAGVSRHVTTNGYLSDEDWGRLGIANGRIVNYPFEITDSVNSLEGIEGMIRIHRNNLKFIFIDNINFVETPKHLRTRYDKLSYVVFELKKIAKKYNIAVFCSLDFPGSEVENRADRRIHKENMNRIFDFSPVDYPFTFYRDDFYNEESEIKGLAEIALHHQYRNYIFYMRFFYEQGKFGNYREDVK